MIALIKKCLPWESNLEKLNNKLYSEILYLKETNGEGELFTNIPNELIEFVKYSQNLKFEQDPDYSYLRSLFIKIKPNYNYLTFSWIKEKKIQFFPRNNFIRKFSPQRILENIQNQKKKD